MSELRWNPDRFSCSKCRAELVPSNADVAGSAGDVSVALRHLPSLSCPDGHERAPTSPDFGEALLDAICSDGGIPVVKRKGMLRKTALCPRCDAELPTETVTASFEVALRLRQPGNRRDVEIDRTDVENTDDPSVFVVELTGPAFVCANCGTRASAAGSGLTSTIRNAVIDAFESNLSGGR